MNGLAPQTSEVFERITRLNCIRPFVLVGGTALSLQINKRQSEDLDFITSIGAMKMEAMLRRSKFRDYYDIYSILNEGADIQEMINMALEHSGHLLKRKNLLAILTDGERFRKDKVFMQLNPVYDVTPYDIQEYIKQKLLEIK